MTPLGTEVSRLPHLLAALHDELPAARWLRRDLHAHPSLSGHEEPTLRQVLAALPAGGAVTRVAGAGAVWRSGGSGPAVAVRAELDGMPITEATGVAWTSTNGAMHACGHDVHLAALVALAGALERVGTPQPLLAVLQPREESYPSGALDIVESGILQRHGVVAMVAAHVQPLLAIGEVACTSGGVNASADEFTVTMRGSGGHAAYPHLTRDPLLALAQFVVSVQQLVSRDADPMVPTVVTVGALQAGAAANAIPDEATARGTVRAMTPDQRDRLHARLREVAEGVALAHGCAATVTTVRGEPVLTNDAHLAERTAALLVEQGLHVTAPLRSCGADDFSYYGDVAPSLMLFVGTGASPRSGLHTATFLPSDSAVEQVATTLLLGYLAACELTAD